MKTRIGKMAGCVLALLSAGNGAVNAQYYGGLDFIRADNAGAESAVPESSFFIANTALDDRRVRYGIKFGYQLTPHFALVTKYSAFDRRSGSSMLPLDSRGDAIIGPSPRSYGIDMIGSLPLFNRFSVSGSAGIARVRGDAIFGSSTSGLFPNPAARALSAGKLGVGVQYDFNRSVGLRFEAERYRNFSANSGAETDAENFSFGVLLKF